MTGIKHYTTSSKGIGGQIKRRISDFVVKEITIQGRTLENKVFGEWEGMHEEQLQIPEKQNATARPPEMWSALPPRAGGEEYLHLTMEKFNLDTNDALRRITRSLRVSPKRIGYAGMKDRRGITVQRISIWQPDLKLLEAFKGRYVALREPEWKNGKLEIGDLKGNEFEITVRDIEMEETKLRRATEQGFGEMEKGVANYFGEQRFGGIRQVTHIVGKEFVKGNFENAVMLYLTHPAQGEEEEIAIARKNLAQTKDFVQATKEFPSKFRYERSIIHHLCKFPKDFVGAFQNLPRHLTYMFTHAYQSYLFNEIINERIERGIGIHPTQGDIIEDGVATAALFGFESTLADGVPGEIERKILERENLQLQDFKIKSFPELSASGARKKIALVPKEMKLLSIGKDEFNDGKLKMKISFSLDKGNYATTILRELMKEKVE